MILLDANIPLDQWALLSRWGVPARRIGREVGEPDISDENILVRLHRLKRPTFFTRDMDFFKARLRQPSFCLAWLDAPTELTAFLIRRFLRHKEFRTHSLRMGVVARVHQNGVNFWRIKQSRLHSFNWE